MAMIVASPRSAGQAPITSNQAVSLVVVKAPELGLWLLNSGDEAAQVRCGEMCGFNVGAFVERPLQKARVQETGLAFILENDWSYMVLVQDGQKKLVTFADLCCQLTNSDGCTEISLTDHDVTQVVEDPQSVSTCRICFNRVIFYLDQDGTPVPFRYGVQPRAKVNVFEPRVPGDAPDRSSIIGATMVGAEKLKKYPICGTMCRVVWEAGRVLQHWRAGFQLNELLWTGYGGQRSAASGHASQAQAVAAM